MKRYPDWSYFPRRTPAPDWVNSFIGAVGNCREQIESKDHERLDSNQVLAALRPDLLSEGWLVEAGKKAADKIARPVLFGDGGLAVVNYEIDGWHPVHKVVLEVESGRGWMGNAFYRDLIRTSLIQDAQYLAIGLRLSYSFAQIKDQNDFQKARDQLDAIFASGRLVLPFDGILLFGW